MKKTAPARADGGEESGNSSAIAAKRKNLFAGVVAAVSRSARNVSPKTNGASVTGPPGFVRTVSGFT